MLREYTSLLPESKRRLTRSKSLTRCLVGFLLTAFCTIPAINAQESRDSRTERIERLIREGNSEEALREADKLVEEYPASWNAHVMRGGVRFRAGKLSESIEDFDRAIELEPSCKPYLWQRGIALYYAGKFAAGREQFEIHQTVNPKDVENSAWHFLCVARLDGVDAARDGLLPIPPGGDNRPTMMEVLALYRGEKTPEEVIGVAESFRQGTQRGELARFYSALYIGLFYEAKNDDKLALEWIRKAAQRSEGGYMLDVAKFHLKQVYGEEVRASDQKGTP